ncbi:MAG: KEOPS complex subunit Pcc1 [Candidatus Woesearchaeota archaeon]
MWLKDALQAQNYNHQSSGKMKYTLELEISDPKLYDLLLPEIRDKGRSTTHISKTKISTQIKIIADDATALRASTDSMIQLLKVYEKVSTK